MAEKRRKRRAILINFSESEELDLKVWEKLLADKAEGRPVRISSLVKKLLYDWYIYRDVGTALWERDDNALNDLGPHLAVNQAVRRQATTDITASDDLAMAFFDSNYDD